MDLRDTVPVHLILYSKQVFLQESDTYRALLHPTQVPFMCCLVEGWRKFDSGILRNLVDALEELVNGSPKKFKFQAIWRIISSLQRQPTWT